MNRFALAHRITARAAGAVNVEFVRASAAVLPFPDASFDAVVSAFVLRSLAAIRVEAAREIRRVLKPGGLACLLELTRPGFPPLRALHRLYVTRALPVLGALAAGASWPRDYLASTILEFPEPGEYREWFTSQGLAHDGTERLTGGICSLLVVRRAGPGA